MQLQAPLARPGVPSEQRRLTSGCRCQAVVYLQGTSNLSTAWPAQGCFAHKLNRCGLHAANARFSNSCPRRCFICRAAPTTSANQLLSTAALLPPQQPQLAFVADTLLNGVLLPVLGGWLLVAALRSVASRARQWCEDNPDEPLSLELLGLLPAALDSPTRLAVLLFVTTRVLRNLAAGLHGFVQTFQPSWNPTAAAWALGIIGWLGPFDAALLKLYIIVSAFVTARVLIKWKSIALEFVLHQQAVHEAAAQDTADFGGSSSISATGKSSRSRKPGGSGSGGAAAAVTSAAGAGPAAAFEGEGVDDFDEAGVVSREGSMLSVTMRPRSSTSTAVTAPALPKDRGPVVASYPDADGAVVAGKPGVAAAAAAAGTGGWAGPSGSSGSRAAVAEWRASQGRGSDDGAVERLLLPLDSILSWAISISAALLAIQTLGINIQPLLAVGGASSLIIGLAMQTLLTNAVMGVSIFVSRPFVPGDSITVQAPGAILVSGVVEKVTPMRTLLRTDDDVLVTLPNKTIADMIVYNKSRREARSRLAWRRAERPFLKFKVKLPHKELQHLQDLQTDLKKVLRRPGVAQQSIEVALSKFTDAGAEVLLQCLLLVAMGSPTAQQLLLDLAVTVRKHGATLVSIL